MFRIFHLSIYVLLLAAAGYSCQTARHFVESGDYDGAIDYCIRKVRGKKNKKTEYVQGLELAFKKAQARDLRVIDHLVAEGRDANWERVNVLHRQIKSRQQKISPLLPLRSKSDYLAHFSFVEIEKLERESRAKAAGYLYDCAEDLLNQADKGDRMAAREAYDKLIEIEQKYFKDFREIRRLKSEALYLGTTHILFEVSNQSRQVLPADFSERILRIGADDLNSRWQSFYTKAEPGVQYDYKMKFNIRNVDISPERVAERAYVDEKEIEDGWEYVLDERGNVKKDTAGNDIKTPRRVIIRAQVLEVFQSKAVRLQGSLDVYDTYNDALLNSEILGTEVLFENYASTFQGDRRALSEVSRNRIGNRPAPFPANEDMLIQAAERLKPSIREALQRQYRRL